MLAKMFGRLKLRINDIKTIKQLFSDAENYAQQQNEDLPGEEHILLAALDLPDGTARQVFEKLATNPATIVTSIQQQYTQALSQLGFENSNLMSGLNGEGIEAADSGKLLYDAKPSVQSLMKALYEYKKKDKDRPLLGADILAVLAEKEHGVAARTLEVLGIDREKLKLIVNEVLEQFRHHG